MSGEEIEVPNSPNLPNPQNLPSLLICNQDSMTDSAYIITLGDTSNAPIVSPPLNGKNYYSWSRAMLMAIGARNKFGFLDGSIPQPASSDPNFSNWYRCNLMVSSWICASVSPEIAQNILYIDSVEKMWKLLKERFEQSNEPRIV
ncbi:hypothetical protein CJ030_MR0G008651 [Morella rubra]|uniref:Retrotransposon Copia-like N-terminal domain-containing protein n=1 Tax=Morella rubra TaxID=262757 RepID=A0A6A1UJM8_9ROSI|nr:hypothetical protein CJ030_MR0G008651 [Morella rubra]